MKFLEFKLIAIFMIIFLLGCKKPEVDEIPYSISLLNDSYEVTQGGTIEIDFLVNDNIEGEKIEVLLLNNVEHGKLNSIENSTKYTYKSNQNYLGTEIFNYQVCVNGNCKSAEVKIDNIEISDECIAFAIGENFKVYDNLLETTKSKLIENDISECSDWDISTFTILNFPQNGTLKVQDNNIVFQGNINWINDDFKYEICNYDGFCKRAIVNLVNGDIEVPVQQ